MEMETKSNFKNPIKLDWNILTPMKENGPPPEVIVVSGQTEDQRLKLQQDINYISKLSNNELDEKIHRLRKQVHGSFALKLPDKGTKLRSNLKLHEDEQERRKKVAEHEESTGSQKSGFPGTCNGINSEAPNSVFAAIFSKNIEKEPDLTCKLRWGHGNKQNTISDRTRSKKGKSEIKAMSKQSSFEFSNSSNHDRNKQTSPINSQKSFEPSNFYETSSGRLSKRKKTWLYQTLPRSRTKEQVTVDLVDEEDCPLEKTTHREDEPEERMQAKIYYPSRDDPDCVELQYSDIQCLAPATFLSSTVMNFYIRYLQQLASRSDFHFFSTYFYGKIEEAVCCKKKDKETFLKFRKWWKGVSLFEKAYIFLPIHENWHWSLVIICLPNMEDESEVTILHLDSLGYHDSVQISQNVRSFLKEEWNYIDNSDLPPPLPIKVWRSLTRRIGEKKIMVPQQKNDYDCGIFVLYYMERFIAEVSGGLGKKELPKFGRQWFKPEQASCLRGEIRKLLEDHFNNSKLGNEKEETSSTSSSDDSVGSCRDVINI